MTHECKMIPFPLKARVGKVRRVAEVFERKTGNSQAAYWKTQIFGLWDALEDLGLTDEEITREMDGFKRAVQSELQRRAGIVHHGDGNPRGAA